MEKVYPQIDTLTGTCESTQDVVASENAQSHSKLSPTAAGNWDFVCLRESVIVQARAPWSAMPLSEENSVAKKQF